MECCRLHATLQLANFALIYYAQTRVKKSTNGLHPANIWTLSINGISVFLDFLQTHLSYDDLAHLNQTFWCRKQGNSSPSLSTPHLARKDANSPLKERRKIFITH